MSRMRMGLLLVALGLAAFPLAGLGLPDRVRIPIAKPHPAGAPQAAALFSHWSHSQYRCFACHPSTFPQVPVGFTHADMNEGRFCARCHAGKTAPAVSQYRCEACHVAR
jgi:c(7)-type cytochrome triheme protein